MRPCKKLHIIQGIPQSGDIPACGSNDNEKDDQKKIASEIPAIRLFPCMSGEA